MSKTFTQIRVGLLVCIGLLASACETTDAPVESAMAQESGMRNVVLISRDASKTATKIDETDLRLALHNAWQQRERRYEKLMPMFEYEMHFDLNNETHVWKVNKLGYLMKSDSSELYRMDVSALRGYMK